MSASDCRPVEEIVALGVDGKRFHARNPFCLLPAVNRDLRHAERIATHIGRKVRGRLPLVSREDEEILAVLDADHRNRRKALSVACHEHDRVVSRRDRKLDLADRDRIEILEHLRHAPPPRRHHTVSLEKGDDFPVREGRGDVHRTGACGSAEFGASGLRLNCRESGLAL